MNACNGVADSESVQGVLLLDLVLFISVIVVVLIVRESNLSADYHILTAGCLSNSQD